MSPVPKRPLPKPLPKKAVPAPSKRMKKETGSQPSSSGSQPRSCGSQPSPSVIATAVEPTEVKKEKSWCNTQWYDDVRKKREEGHASGWMNRRAILIARLQRGEQKEIEELLRQCLDNYQFLLRPNVTLTLVTLPILSWVCSVLCICSGTLLMTRLPDCPCKPSKRSKPFETCQTGPWSCQTMGCGKPSLSFPTGPETARWSLQTLQTLRNLPNWLLELPNYGLWQARSFFFYWPETAGCSLQSLQTLRNLPSRLLELPNYRLWQAKSFLF